MRWITLDDFIDGYFKIRQRGIDFFFSKFSLNKKARTRSAFNESAEEAANWWIIPKVLERWNSLITGNPKTNYKEHLIEAYFKDRSGIKLLSLGSGDCSHELELATYSQFDEILCIDLAENRLDEAREKAKKQGLTNIHFLCTDLEAYEFPANYFNVVLFNASLHHFENVEQLLANPIKTTLASGGLLVINEFVGPNRLQYPKNQLRAINEALQLIDPPFRKRYKTNSVKNHYYGSGVWRMIMADPSECVDSHAIMPAIHKHFKTLEEKPYGGSILMSVLKDISHHFVNPDKRGVEILETLFAFEDNYLKEHSSDFVFGVYEKA
ncbi:methyltransferase family protein [Ulvibacter sp. MAR_2010_11]|uniref:class I SAM-dependent methyltransferase n=1 Tax=Ulvibacter sp. MAR_2010_11 TaxID=1250229 RepID=UPI000C2C25A5|nr:class I SAM-dependent methyltransferase [Ulvibacter sp. MAR_2010_11]PKA83068.1 methyltransferase family protein [Ulvibacter sp. MAR_2010_11]